MRQRHFRLSPEVWIGVGQAKGRKASQAEGTKLAKALGWNEAGCASGRRAGGGGAEGGAAGEEGGSRARTALCLPGSRSCSRAEAC